MRYPDQRFVVLNCWPGYHTPAFSFSLVRVSHPDHFFFIDQSILTLILFVNLPALMSLWPRNPHLNSSLTFYSNNDNCSIITTSVSLPFSEWLMR